jgi:hypothetical protein
VRCKSTGYVAKINFKHIGWLGMWGQWNGIDGSIKKKERGAKVHLYDLSGTWDTQVIMTDVNSSATTVSTTVHHLPSRSSMITLLQGLLS